MVEIHQLNYNDLVLIFRIFQNSPHFVESLVSVRVLLRKVIYAPIQQVIKNHTTKRVNKRFSVKMIQKQQNNRKIEKKSQF